MASPAQIAANRRNARKSTGPTTAEGKSRVSRNAITHGVRSTGDPAALQQLVAVLTAQHRPVGAAQELCILRIALAILKINYSDHWENEAWNQSGGDYADLDALERTIHISVIHARYRVPLHRLFYESHARLRSLKAKAGGAGVSACPSPRERKITKQSQFTSGAAQLTRNRLASFAAFQQPQLPNKPNSAALRTPPPDDA